VVDVVGGWGFVFILAWSVAGESDIEDLKE
jgi:hypothetical protein